MRVYRVRGLADGAVEIMLCGQPDDAAYIARCIALHPGATIDKPATERTRSAIMYLVARGHADQPITVEIAKRLLKKHPKTGWLSTT